MLLPTLALAATLLLSALRRGGMGQILHQILVVDVAEALNRRPIAAMAKMLSLTLLAGLVLTAPELLALAGAVDLALFVELGMLVALARGADVFRALAAPLRRHGRRTVSPPPLRRPPARAPRSPRRIRRKPAAADEPEPAWAFA